MTTVRKKVGLSAGLAIAVTMALALVAGSARATHEASDNGVVPILVAGNPNCAALNADNANFPSITSDFGWKIDEGAPNNGVYTLTAGTQNGDPTVLTGGAIADPSNSITISNSDGFFFDWAASLGIDAVLVKAGNAAATYVYTPESFADGGLHAPDQKDISHVEFCYDYEFTPGDTLSKTADGTFDRTIEWDLEKTVDPDSHEGFIGDSFQSTWTVTATKTVTDSNFEVSGTITLFNPAPFPINVDVSDELDDGTVAAVDCDPNTNGDQNTGIVLAASPASIECTYTASPADDSATENTVTVTVNTGGVGGDSFTIPFAWSANVSGDDTVTVDDDRDTEGQFPADISDSETFDYVETFDCSTDPADYAGDGVDGPDTFENTATLKGDNTDLSRMADVDVTCYAPTLSKTAEASVDETWTWTLEKTVAPLSQTGDPGETLEWTWTVTVGESSEQDNFAVSGTITVGNPAGAPDDITVDVADQLDDGTVATVDCDGFGATSVTVAPGETEDCTYEASPADATATENEATGTFNGFDFTASADVDFATNTINGTATVDDDREPDFPADLVAGDGGQREWTETESVTCSEDRDFYVSVGFMYGDTEYNTATLTSDDQNLQADASTDWMCQAGFVDIFKTTNGFVDPTKDIQFELYSGQTVLETVGTLNDGDGTLEFQTALTVGATYTICEAPVPAAFTFQPTINGGVVLSYAGPPGAQNPTGEIQCFDFTAEKDILEFAVDNRFPGGGPRTPGYWKNWNTCSSGNQAATAEKLGGTAEGVFLLDDLLPQMVGALTVDSCDIAVSILDSRDVNNGRKQGNDGAYILARSYLAALLNQDAGACVPTDTFDVAGVGDDLTFQEALNAAQALLEGVGFDGTGKYLGPKDKSGDREIALALYGIIDDYNNGELCDGAPSH